MQIHLFIRDKYRKTFAKKAFELDVYIEKLSPNGNFIWVRTFGGAEPEYVGGFDIDSLGNIYLTGFFEKTCNFSTNSEIKTYVSQGSFDVYFIKLNDEGDLLKIKTFGGKYDDHGYAICINKNGNIYLTGRFYDKILNEEFEEMENLKQLSYELGLSFING